MKVPDLVLKTLDRVLLGNSESDPIESAVKALTSFLSLNGESEEAIVEILRTATNPYFSLAVDQVLNEKNKLEAMLKLLEAPKRGLIILRTRKAKLALTKISLKNLLANGSCLERYRELENLRKNIKLLDILDVPTYVRLYIALAYGYASLGLFEDSLKMLSKAARVALFTASIFDVTFALKHILLLYMKAPRLKEDEVFELLKARDFVGSVEFLLRTKDPSPEIISEVQKKRERLGSKRLLGILDAIEWSVRLLGLQVATK